MFMSRRKYKVGVPVVGMNNCLRSFVGVSVWWGGVRRGVFFMWGVLPPC